MNKHKKLHFGINCYKRCNNVVTISLIVPIFPYYSRYEDFETKDLVKG